MGDRIFRRLASLFDDEDGGPRSTPGLPPGSVATCCTARHDSARQSSVASARTLSPPRGSRRLDPLAGVLHGATPLYAAKSVGGRDTSRASVPFAGFLERSIFLAIKVLGRFTHPTRGLDLGRFESNPIRGVARRDTTLRYKEVSVAHGDTPTGAWGRLRNRTQRRRAVARCNGPSVRFLEQDDARREPVDEVLAADRPQFAHREEPGDGYRAEPPVDHGDVVVGRGEERRRALGCWY